MGKCLARRLGYRFFESGTVYRAVAVKVREAGIDPDDREAVLKIISGLEEISPRREFYHPEVSRLASVLSADPGVREGLMKLQRREAEKGDLVVEGRDMGSRVFPEAEVKFFLQASIDVRARRRCAELKAEGREVDLEGVRSDLAERDRRDSTRAASPLVIPEGAIVVDTSDLTIDEVVDTLAGRVGAGKTGGG